jgi:hypothetical protein
MRPTSAIFLFAALGVVGCASVRMIDEGGHPVRGAREFTYQYIGKDQRGHDLVKGQLNVRSHTAGTVSGTWDLKYVGSVPMTNHEFEVRFGPQIGEGKINGRIAGTAATLQLNEVIDNSVELKGEWSQSHFAGTWRYLSDAGVTASGTFDATAVK